MLVLRGPRGSLVIKGVKKVRSSYYLIMLVIMCLMTLKSLEFFKVDTLDKK